MFFPLIFFFLAGATSWWTCWCPCWPTGRGAGWTSAAPRVMVKMSALSSPSFFFLVGVICFGNWLYYKHSFLDIIANYHLGFSEPKPWCWGNSLNLRKHGSPLALQQKEQPEETMEDGPGPPLTREQQRSLRAFPGKGGEEGKVQVGEGEGESTSSKMLLRILMRQVRGEKLQQRICPSKKNPPAKQEPKRPPNAKQRQRRRRRWKRKRPNQSQRATRPRTPPQKNLSLLPRQQNEQGRRSTGNGNGQDRSESKSGKRKEAGSPVPVDQRAGFKKFFGLFILFSCACIFNTGLVDGLGGWFDMVGLYVEYQVPFHYQTKNHTTLDFSVGNV